MSWKAGLLTPPLLHVCVRFWFPSNPRLCWRSRTLKRVRAARTREARVGSSRTRKTRASGTYTQEKQGNVTGV